MSFVCIIIHIENQLYSYIVYKYCRVHIRFSQVHRNWRCRTWLVLSCLSWHSCAPCSTGENHFCLGAGLTWNSDGQMAQIGKSYQERWLQNDGFFPVLTNEMLCLQDFQVGQAIPQPLYYDPELQLLPENFHNIYNITHYNTKTYL